MNTATGLTDEFGPFDEENSDADARSGAEGQSLQVEDARRRRELIRQFGSGTRCRQSVRTIALAFQRVRLRRRERNPDGEHGQGEPDGEAIRVEKRFRANCFRSSRRAQRAGGPERRVRELRS